MRKDKETELSHFRSNGGRRGGGGGGGRGAFSMKRGRESDSNDFVKSKRPKAQGRRGSKKDRGAGNGGQKVEILEKEDMEEDVDGDDLSNNSTASLSGVEMEDQKTHTKTNSSGDESSYLSNTRFDQCSVVSPLSLKAIKDAGYEKMTMVQEASLPAILKDLTIMVESKPVVGLSWEPKLSLFSTGTKTGSANKPENQPEGTSLWKPSCELVDGLFVAPNNPRKLNKLLKKQVKDTAGKSWFDMPAPTITPEMKKDLQLLKLRNVIDPKRHYKKTDSKSKTLPKYFQVGTVIESASDFYSGRLTKKERKATLADELLADRSLGDYRKRRVREIEEHNQPGGNEKWKIRGRQSQRRAKQRRH